MIELKIRQQNAGGRIDKFLCKYLDKAPKNFVYKMLRKKNIVLNDKKAAGSEILKEGDCIRLYLADDTINSFRTQPPPGKKTAQPQTDALIKKLEPLILYEDANLIALNKPAGMLSQKADPRDVSLNECLLAYLSVDPKREAGFTAGISNRLDRNTSGIVLAGKNPAASRELNRAIKEKDLQKLYVTLVKGRIEKPETVCALLVKEEASNRVTVTDINPAAGSAQKNTARADGKDAPFLIRTGYRPLASSERFTFLEVELHTGKSHQIRAHLAHLGHPVVGDSKYGDPQQNAYFRNTYGLNAQFLHAEKITFLRMEGIIAYLNGTTIRAPLPSDLTNIIKGEHLWRPGTAED